MNQIAARRLHQTPAPMGRVLSNMVAKYRNRLEEHPGPFRHFSISERMAPTAIERKALEDRRQDLNDALVPADTGQIAQEIGMLKAGFSSFGIDAVSAQVQVAIYAEALVKFPLWAIREARFRFRDGRNATPWKPSECPTSAQFAAECRAIIAPVHDELSPLSSVLDASIYPDPDPDQQRRLAAVMQWEEKIRPGMAAREEARPTETPEDALERLRQEGLGTVIVGDGLQKKFAAIREGRD